MIDISTRYATKSEIKSTTNNIKLSATGLSSEEVLASRREHGNNKLSRIKQKSFLRQFISNLGDPVIKILMGALVINSLFAIKSGQWAESIGIAISVCLATFISTMSEYGSRAAFERLEESCEGQLFRVLRGGEIKEIVIGDLVVGDVVLVGAGEQIPADGILIEGKLTCDQSAMTGESREVSKRAIKHSDSEDNTPSSPYFCLRGCSVLTGEGRMRISAVGDRTFLGGISREIQTDTRESPLKLRLAKLAKQISTIGYIAAILVSLIYLFNVFVADSVFDLNIIRYKLTDLPFLFSSLLHALTLGLTVVVVAVPEGLPMMIAVVLSANVKKMVRDRVLVRKPVGIEAAGSMNILFTDKTGTLTEGNMSVCDIISGDGTAFTSFKAIPDGKMRRLYLLSALYNTTSVRERSSGAYRIIGGNSTDRAITASVGSAPSPSCSLIKSLPFDSERKYSSAALSYDGKKLFFIKGAYDRLIPHITKYLSPEGKVLPASRKKLEDICLKEAKRGRRVLLAAYSESSSQDKLGQDRYSQASLSPHGNLTLLCVISLEDKLRRDAPGAVEKLKRAGIHVVMITGDGKETARRIAEDCGIIDSECNVVLTASDLNMLTDVQLSELLPKIAVVARALPGDKSRLVRISQDKELGVGMTGDGINDAPALKRSDVGFAMGSGTQVAKDAGDIIILDNSLASIAKAVLYGRNIFKSIRKFISLQLMMNFCAVGVSMICPFLGYETPVTVVQMLWINIIMDTLGGLAFAGEPALDSCMDERPKRRDEPILNGYMIYEIVFGGGFTVALCIAFLKLPEITALFRTSPDRLCLLTAFFALFIFASVFNCFCARSDRLRIFANITKNKAFISIMAAIVVIQIAFIYLGGSVLRTTPLLPRELFATVALALPIFPADMIRKLIWRGIAGKKGY